VTPNSVNPGLVLLFGSGETAPAGREAHDLALQQLHAPPRVAILETPAGFQPNSAWVAGRLAEFVQHSLQNHHPQVTVLPLRRREQANDPTLAAPLLEANYVFAGPGSPTYTVQHLRDTWAWQVIQARQRRGAALAFASAAAIALSAHVLPVYEIYKVGTALHWQPGLDFFRPYGLDLAVVTHWDNQEGGENLDTRRAFMGLERMARLLEMLPPSTTVLGIDEHTAVLLDLLGGTAQVVGRGSATVCRAGAERVFASGATFALDELGTVRIPPLDEGLPVSVVEAVLAAGQEALPPQVAALIEQREAARRARDWPRADALRDEIARLGYMIEDTPAGPRWKKL